VLSLGNQNGFMADELKRLNGELNSLDRSIGKLESQPVAAEPIELAASPTPCSASIPFGKSCIRKNNDASLSCLSRPSPCRKKT
jgi:hypothetical protein